MKRFAASLLASTMLFSMANLAKPQENTSQIQESSSYFQLETQYNYGVNSELDSILNQLPYTGDITKINLSPEQAIAMAEEIESFSSPPITTYWGDEATTIQKVALFDAGEHTPGLLEFKAVSESYYDGTDEKALYWDESTGTLQEFQRIGARLAVNVTAEGTEILTGDHVSADWKTFFKATTKMISGKPQVVYYEMLYFSAFETILLSKILK